jgi:hypothetical protein
MIGWESIAGDTSLMRVARRDWNDHVRFPCLRERQNRVRGYSLVDHEFRLNFIVGVVLHEFLQLLAAAFAKRLLELLIESRGGSKAGGRMSP